jgi:hypothetical protein
MEAKRQQNHHASYSITNKSLHALLRSHPSPRALISNVRTRFDETYAALNLQINSRLAVDNYKLDEFRLTIDGSAHAQSIVTITDPVRAAEAFLNRMFEELDVGGCMSTIGEKDV